MRNPLGTLDAVRVSENNIDPAIDQTKSNLDAYRKTRDVEHLVFVDGAKPAVFKVGQLRAAFLMDNIARCSTDSSRRMMAFLASVHEVVMPDGSVKKPLRFDKGAYNTKSADDSWLDVVRALFSISVVLEMGQCAIDLAQFSDDEAAAFFWPGG